MCKAFGRPSWPFALLYQVLTLYPSFSGHKKDIIKSLEKQPFPQPPIRPTIAVQKIHKILDDFSKGIQYKLILTTQDNDSGCCPIVLFFFFCLLFSCGSFVFYDVGFGQRKKKMLLPKETVRKRSIIIINEFSAHNTFYSLFKWISLSSRQVLLL